jgi:hypothetical protein
MRFCEIAVAHLEPARSTRIVSSSSASAPSINGSGPPSRTAKSRHPSQVGVDGLEVAHTAKLGSLDCGAQVTALLAVFANEFSTRHLRLRANDSNLQQIRRLLERYGNNFGQPWKWRQHGGH